MALAEFEGWLTEMLPEAAQSLNPPVTDEALADFEQRTGLHMPDGLAALYRWHDGQSLRCFTGIFYGMSFMPLAQVLDEWQFWAEEAQVEPQVEAKADALVQPNYANRRWIPFASDGGGNFLAVDLDPGPRGRPGQVINMGRDEFQHYVLGADTLRFIEWMLGELRQGNYTIANEGDGGHSFNMKQPDTRHFLDAAKIVFGKAKPRVPAAAPSGPPRDSTIGTFYFIRSEAARQIPSGWSTLSIEGRITGNKEQRTVALKLECVADGASSDIQLSEPDALGAAFVELQDRTADEGWRWNRMKIDFDAQVDHRFMTDAE